MRMGRTTSLVVSWTPSSCEPFLAVLRARGLCPAVIGDAERAALSAVASENALILLHGSRAFCESFFEAVGKGPSQKDLCSVIILACDSSEAFAVAALRMGAKD